MMRLVVITAGGLDLVARVRALLDVGAEVLVREPTLPEGLPLDRVMLSARMLGAERVATALHLPGGSDLADCRARFSGPLGYSAHTPDEARAALAAGATTVFLSPLFAARHGRPALGHAALAPGALDGLIALGGVEPRHASALARAGAAGAAVQGGVWRASDPVAAALTYLSAFRAAAAGAQ